MSPVPYESTLHLTKEFSMIHPRTVVFFLLLLLLASATVPAHAAPRSSAPTPPPPSPQEVAPQATTDCSANSSPFGGVLTLGREQEALVSYAGGFGSSQQSWLLNARYDLNSSNSVFLQNSWPPPGQTPPALLQSVNAPVAAAVDLNGDGKDELAQAFTNNNGNMYLSAFSANGSATADMSRILRRQLAIAAGNPTRRSDEARRVAIASVIDPASYGADPQLTTGAGGVSVIVPFVKNDGTFFNATESKPAIWSTVEHDRAFPEALSLAIGDLDGDGFQDNIVLALADRTGAIQIIVLAFDGSAAATGSPETTFSDRLKEVASTKLTVNNPYSVKVVVGDVDARYRNGDPKNFAGEIVLATDDENPDSPGVSDGIKLYTFGLRTVIDEQGTVVSRSIEQRGSYTASVSHSDLQLAIGDTDGDGRAEPVLAYRSYGDNNPLVIQTFDAERPTITAHNRIATFDNNRNGVGSLALAVGDMNRDGLADISAAFRDNGNQLQVLRAIDQGNVVGDNGIQVSSFTRDATGGRNGAYAITAALGDWDGDSLTAVYAPAYGGSVRCASVEEPNLAAVVFPPPFWERLQGSRERVASLGKSVASGGGVETNIETSASHSVSVSLGAEVGGEVAGIGLEASLKATGGYEYRSTQSSGGGTESTVRLSQNFENREGPFVVVQRTHHDCYTYQLKQGAAQLNAEARFCEDRGHDTVGPNLANWDSDYGPVKNPGSQQWSPIGRDWAGLSLFRNATQSSTAGAASASRAVDGNTGDLSAAHSAYVQTGARLSQNTVSSTNVEPHPWWQVDIGLTQPLTALRIWHRYNLDCGQQTCAGQMGGFYVFVSDVDLGTISNDPSVLKNDARVHSYFFDRRAEKVTNIQTLANQNGLLTPIRGRYVRVQLVGTAALSLAEVQAFGEQHLDPDHYPVWVRDPDATKTRVPDPDDGNKIKTRYTPGTDGWFEVGVHAPDGTIKPVRMRGNLLWSSNGALQFGDTAGQVKITKGDAVFNWSLAAERRDFLTQRQSIENNVKFGAEFEAQGGVGLKVTVGGGYEFTTGVLTDTTNTVAWSKGLEIGGGIQGFPERLNGKTISLNDIRNCEYAFQPFYYEADEEATSGYQHRFLAVDSVVPESALDRNADLSFCQASASDTPLLESNVSSGAPGSNFILTAAGFAANSRATLALKGPGDAVFRTLAQLTLKENGQLVFVLATKPTDSLGDYSVRLTVDSAANQGAGPAATQTLTTNIALRAGETVQTGSPPGAPIISTDGRITGGLRMYVPLIRR
jgi:hypothetical protein